MLKVANSVINASQITGVLPVVNGGTGVTTSTGTGNTVLSAAPTLSGDVTLSTGNLIPGTAAKGINFTANTPAAGMTSQLLNWYEEGTWTPIVAPFTGSITSYTATGRYTKIGRSVVLSWNIFIINNGTGAGYLGVTGMPYSASAANIEAGVGIETAVVGFAVVNYFVSVSNIAMTNYINGYPGGTGYKISSQITYQI
jgi:hypothetical protein